MRRTQRTCIHTPHSSRSELLTKTMTYLVCKPLYIKAFFFFCIWIYYYYVQCSFLPLWRPSSTVGVFFSLLFSKQPRSWKEILLFSLHCIGYHHQRFIKHIAPLPFRWDTRCFGFSSFQTHLTPRPLATDAALVPVAGICSGVKWKYVNEEKPMYKPWMLPGETIPYKCRIKFMYFQHDFEYSRSLFAFFFFLTQPFSKSLS